MKTIGLLGGMTCESTVPCYRIINRLVNERLGREHSAKLILYSLDFEELASPMNSGRWDEVGRIPRSFRPSRPMCGFRFST